VHNGCGTRLLTGRWISAPRLNPSGSSPENFIGVDLAAAHPFPSSYFAYTFAEDFPEDISQADALIFLREAHRTLRNGGVLRLRFPDF